MLNVSDTDCAIFVQQAHNFAAKVGGVVMFQSAMYADIKDDNGYTHSLIGPGNAEDGFDWLGGNRKYIRQALRR